MPEDQTKPASPKDSSDNIQEKKEVIAETGAPEETGETEAAGLAESTFVENRPESSAVAPEPEDMSAEPVIEAEPKESVAAADETEITEAKPEKSDEPTAAASEEEAARESPVKTLSPEPGAEPPQSEPVELKTEQETADKTADTAGEVATTEEPRATENIIEKVVEKEKPLTEADKDQIFRDKLKAKLAQANVRKQENFEAHLREMVDFMKQKNTLVTNQDIEIGLDLPDSTVTKRLNDLIKRGLVVRLGDQYHAKYKLKDAI